MRELDVDERSLRQLVASCQRVAELSPAALDRCANLAPAGTGSGSLSNALAALPAKYKYTLGKYLRGPDVLYRCPMPPIFNKTRSKRSRRWAGAFFVPNAAALIVNVPIVDHKHSRRIAGFEPFWPKGDVLPTSSLQLGPQKSLPDHKGGSPECFVMTVRDPADRLESGFRAAFNDRAYRTLFGGHRSLQSFVDALRHREAHALRAFNQSFASPAYRFEDGGSCCDEVDGGSNFLTAQVDYLSGIDGCRAGLPIHFLCTETLDADFARLKRRRSSSEVNGSNDAAAQSADPAIMRYHVRHDRFTGSEQGDERHRTRFTSVTTLAPHDRRFIRDELYALDTILYDLVCSSRIAYKSNLTSSSKADHVSLLFGSARPLASVPRDPIRRPRPSQL